MANGMDISVSPLLLALFAYCYRPLLPEGLPRSFDTPMFWSEEEIEYLKGTAVYGMHSHIVTSQRELT